MIARVIKEHFDREKVLKPQHIKVLSLFFIDRVDHYRVHGPEGARSLGKYGVFFEEEYRKLAAHPDYKDSLFSKTPADPASAHDGYFSKDRHGKVTEPELNAAGEMKNATSREDAERGFRLIMRDKERLLDEAEPLRFIFSHSALREGWDNPNVFQICMLREPGTDRERRQTIGRGLRLCVDSKGERRRDEGLNVLTVVADESYAAFAEGLQKQIEDDLGIKFGTVEQNAFAALSFEDADGELEPVGVARSAALFDFLRDQGFVDAKGRIEDSLRRELKAGTLALPEAFDAVAPAARALLTKLAGRLEVRDADKKRPIALNREIFLGEDFRALWDRIKAKTTYRMVFDNEALIVQAAARLKADILVARAQARWRKARYEVTRAGVAGVEETTSDFIALTPETFDVLDVLGELQNRTQLTRKTLARVLVDSGRLDDLRVNPAAFIDQAAQSINRVKIAAESYYAQALFEAEELQGYLDKMIAAEKSVTEQIRYDSTTERTFAEGLNANEAVKVFAKLPDWFKVPTPLGAYNPDWAVLIATTEGDRLYFVVETKANLLIDDLRPREAAKIRCGEAHFREVANGGSEPTFIQAVTVDDLLRIARAPSTPSGSPAPAIETGEDL